MMPAPTNRDDCSMTDLLTTVGQASRLPSLRMAGETPALRLRGAWPHLVPHRLLRRRNHLGRPALGGDLLRGGLREVMRLDDQFLGQFAMAKDADAVRRPLRQPRSLQRLAVDDIALVKRRVEVADVDDEVVL